MIECLRPPIVALGTNLVSVFQVPLGLWHQPEINFALVVFCFSLTFCESAYVCFTLCDDMMLDICDRSVFRGWLGFVSFSCVTKL